jgi:SAM-dependent methyltransferase
VSDKDRYLHGVEPGEQDRLSRLNDLLNAASLREASIEPGERLVDFGSGLGQLTRAFARASGGTGRVVGIERDGEQLEGALERARAAGEADLVDFRRGSAYEPPIADDEWGTFDTAHARFVLEHLSDPQAAVDAMVRAVRPGGRVILQDDDHDTLRLWPEPPGFSGLWASYVRTISLNQNDPYIGRRLGTLLHRAGAPPVRSSQVFFGSCAGSDTFPTLLDNLIGVIEGVRTRMIRGDLFEERDYDRAIEDLRSWGGRPDAALWYAVPWIEGRRAV